LSNEVAVEINQSKVANQCERVRWLYLRLLGLVYLIAFSSLGVQVVGLLGRHGISPASNYLYTIAMQMGGERYLLCPTLAWINSGDAALQMLCWGGALASLLVVAGVCTAPALLICYVLYVSLVNIGQEFLGYQWDFLLLEVGFVSIFLPAWQVFEKPWPRAKTTTPAPMIVIWLLRIIVFKLMLMSGLAKIESNDPTWSNLTALNYHYETQPLPTPLAWVAAQLPELFQKFSVVMMFFIELVAPFFIFTTRKLRAVAAGLIAFLQVLIAITGNYTFFNLLSISLCVSLLDDSLLQRLLPAKLKFDLQAAKVGVIARKYFHIAIACLLIPLNVGDVFGHKFLPLALLHAAIEPFGISNGYGLFAVMTTERNEIIVEGSNDNVTWLPYEFPYKPGDVRRAPPIVAPFQPRLDWQMWFASLETFEGNPWFGRMLLRLLQGSPDVLKLFSKNPFPDAPPKYVRASFYRYHFTDFATFSETGDWWRRECTGMYCPTASLQDAAP
jgi:uncharacterized membrane protein YphA (DoxX/SURF4 family)